MNASDDRVPDKIYLEFLLGAEFGRAALMLQQPSRFHSYVVGYRAAEVVFF